MYLFNLLLRPFRMFPQLPRKLLGMSLAARAALLIGVFLVCCVITAYAAFYFSQNRTPWELWWRPGRIAALVLLVIVIPLVVYQALRLWLEGETSRFPDIDYAWNAGLAELERHGLDLTEVPIFLVLGSTSSLQERSLFQAARLNFRIEEFPHGPAALHWFAGPDAVYLCLSEVGQISKLAALGARAASNPDALDGSSAGSPAPSDANVVRGTIMVDREAAAVTPLARAGGAAQGSPAADIRGTMMVSHDVNVGDLVAAFLKHMVVLPPADAVEQQARLKYLGRLLRRARQPLCPINGLVTLLPYDQIERSPREAVEVEQAVKQDLATLRHELKLRCPVTAIVVGWERESGFRELVRRVGADRARNQRFGKGFALWATATPAQLEAVSVHACGAFEDWVYALFREAGALAKPGNTQLYAMLCNVRRNLQSRLASILVSGYGQEHETIGEGDGALFGGCYFAALGETQERQAFVKGVLDKLIEQQEDLEWTAEALSDEGRCRRVAMTLWSIDVLLLAALLGTLAYKLLA